MIDFFLILILNEERRQNYDFLFALRLLRPDFDALVTAVLY